MTRAIRSSIENFVYRRFFARQIDLSGIESRISFTFDDFPVSAWLNGGVLLEKYSAKGTFYLAPGLCGKTTEVGKIVSRSEVIKCARAGHEIGNHSYCHLNYREAGKREIIADVTKAKKDMSSVEMENFSFPFGECNTNSKICLRTIFKSCRGIQSGVNRGLTDLLELRSNAVYSQNNNLDSLQQTICDLKSHQGWLILYTHDVNPDPSPYGCTSEDLECLISTAIDNDIPIKSVAESIAELT